MKIKLSALLLFSILSSASAWAQSFEAKSRVSATSIHKMTVRVQNDIAYVSISSVPFDNTILSEVKDFANVGLADGRFNVPSDGGSYWIVPFLGGTAIRAIGGDSYCLDCICKSTGEPQSSGCHLIGNTCGGSCGGCTTVSRPCDASAAVIEGPFAIVKASQVFFD